MADTDSGGMNAIVAVVAIIAILIIGYFVIQTMRGQNTGTQGIDVNVGIPGGQQSS